MHHSENRNSFEKIAKILRVESGTLLELEEKMVVVGGKKGVIQKIAEENGALVDKTLENLGLSRESRAEEVREALEKKIVDLDKKLPTDWEELCKKALNLVEDSPSTSSGYSQTIGFFIKKEKAMELLKKYPPKDLGDFEKEPIESVFAALRFTQTTEWMHKFFEEAYNDLRPEDFEERPIQLKVLEEKWLDVADKFLEKKYHNVSHLKELGIIFVIPLNLDSKGEALRVFTLLLHYLNEVPFYSKLFRKFSREPDFIDKLKSLLRGDVLEKSMGDWLIIQRYLAKDDKNDPRLLIPHINPEAEHWYKAEESLAKLGPDFSFWKDLDFTQFNLIDAVMTLVKKGEAKYIYHQQEALWNKIFIEYFGREKMNELIEENIIKGYIEF